MMHQCTLEPQFAKTVPAPHFFSNSLPCMISRVEYNLEMKVNAHGCSQGTVFLGGLICVVVCFSDRLLGRVTGVCSKTHCIQTPISQKPPSRFHIWVSVPFPISDAETSYSNVIYHQPKAPQFKNIFLKVCVRNIILGSIFRAEPLNSD